MVYHWINILRNMGKYMDPVLKLEHSLDALFGNGTSKYLPKNLEIILSRKTGRI